MVSPLLANVDRHELDKHLERYTGLSASQKARRRRPGQANFAYARYADDLVIRCNGTKEQALAMREEVRQFLTNSLHLTLSMATTNVTHLNEGFDFLGFHVQRSRGPRGMATKRTISATARERHRGLLRAATAPSTQADSLATNIPALNRIIRGWCRYFQYTSKAQAQFARLDHATFWLVAHWLGRKHRLALPAILARYYSKGKDATMTLGEGEVWLVKHTSVKTRRYRGSPLKPTPYTTQEVAIEREELLDDHPWLGTEARPGMTDRRPRVLKRDAYRCAVCPEPVTNATAQVDHLRPVCSFKRPVDANHLDNLQTRCVPCHAWKTEYDRQTESRMP
jgi:RNA-directed DNA polymerase